MSLAYNVTKTSTAIASVDRIDQSPEPVALTIYVHDGDINGAMLAGVQVTGQDAAGNGFEGMTDSGGTVTINGVPGTWQFILSKEGYDTINLDYDVTQTEEIVAFFRELFSPRIRLLLQSMFMMGTLTERCLQMSWSLDRMQQATPLVE